MTIKPISQSLLKIYASLNHKKYRQKYGLFIGEGKKILQEALQGSYYPIESIVILPKQEKWIRNQRIPDHIPIYLCKESLYKRLSTLENAEGVLVVFKKVQFGAVFPERALILAHLMDPGNVGTLLRTAYVFGLSSCIFLKPCVDGFNPKVVRASMGAVLHMEIIEVSSEELRRVTDEGAHVAIAHLSGKPIHTIDFNRIRYLLLGSESHGAYSILKLLKKSTLFSIPQKSQFDSLNVSIAGGISLYEWLIRNSGI